jgi:hypothetical protein
VNPENSRANHISQTFVEAAQSAQALTLEIHHTAPL